MVKLEDGPWKSRIAEPKRPGLNWWNGDHAARRVVYNNRARLTSGRGKAAAKQRTELVERRFEHTLNRDGMRRIWLRGLENVHKRYLIHVAGFNLGLLMRQLTGYGAPKGAADDLFLLLAAIPYASPPLLLVVLGPLNQHQQPVPIAVALIGMGED